MLVLEVVVVDEVVVVEDVVVVDEVVEVGVVVVDDGVVVDEAVVVGCDVVVVVGLHVAGGGGGGPVRGNSARPPNVTPLTAVKITDGGQDAAVCGHIDNPGDPVDRRLEAGVERATGRVGRHEPLGVVAVVAAVEAEVEPAVVVDDALDVAVEVVGRVESVPPVARAPVAVSHAPTMLKCWPPMPTKRVPPFGAMSRSRMSDVVAGSGASTPAKRTGNREPVLPFTAARLSTVWPFTAFSRPPR